MPPLRFNSVSRKSICAHLARNDLHRRRDGRPELAPVTANLTPR